MNQGLAGFDGFAEDQVERAVVEVGEVGGEALGGAEGAADLFDGGVVAALGLDAGAGGEADEALEEWRTGRRRGARCRWGGIGRSAIC